MYKIGNRLFL